MKQYKKVQDFECKSGIFLKCSKCGKKINKGHRVGPMFGKDINVRYICDNCFWRFSEFRISYTAYGHKN